MVKGYTGNNCGNNTFIPSLCTKRLKGVAIKTLFLYNSKACVNTSKALIWKVVDTPIAVVEVSSISRE